MIDPRYRVFLGLAPLIGLGLLVLAVMDPDSGPNPVEYFFLGNLFGTMFGHATLAAAWSALGPFPVAWRMPLSLVWVTALIIALTVSLVGHDMEVVIVIGGCVLAQWLLVQIPLWLLAAGYGLRLTHRDEVSPASSPRDRQFGIRQLLILTTIVAVVLALGRAVLLSVSNKISLDRGDAPIFIFLGVAGILLTLPLLMAALLPRWAIPASLAVLVLIAVATEWELTLLSAIPGMRPGGPDVWHFRLINAFTAAWVLAIVGLLRWGGYSLAPPRGESPLASTP